MDPAQQQAVMQQILQGDVGAMYNSYIQQAPATFAALGLPTRLLPIRGQPGVESTLVHNQAYSGRTSAVAGFPVRRCKYVLLRQYIPNSVFFYTADYDINLVTPHVNPIEQAFLARFLHQGVQVLLSILLPYNAEISHAVAGILVPGGTLFVVNTYPTDPVYLGQIKQFIDGLTGQNINVVDVVAGTGINLQANADELFCVTWMLVALTQLGSAPVTLERAQQHLRDMAMMKAQDPPDQQNKFIIEVLEDLKSKYNSSGGKRKMRRKTAKKWIQDVVKKMKKGAFTQQALKHHETPEQYADDVLKHPKKHTLKTRRRAQFLMNLRKTKKSSHSKK